MNFDDIEVRVNEKYPKLLDVKEDKKTSAILKNLISSRAGNLSCILRYAYQSVIADKTNEEIGEIFEEIAVVKMTHMDMLMHAVSLCGGNPRFEDDKGNMFNAGYVFYSNKLKEMLEFNIQNSIQTIQDYKNAISLIPNQSIKDLLNRLIQDETRHKEIFNRILNSVHFLSV